MAQASITTPASFAQAVSSVFAGPSAGEMGAAMAST
jgi:hypothetical protein